MQENGNTDRVLRVLAHFDAATTTQIRLADPRFQDVKCVMNALYILGTKQFVAHDGQRPFRYRLTDAGRRALALLPPEPPDTPEDTPEAPAATAQTPPAGAEETPMPSSAPSRRTRRAKSDAGSPAPFALDSAGRLTIIGHAAATKLSFDRQQTQALGAFMLSTRAVWDHAAQPST